MNLIPLNKRKWAFGFYWVIAIGFTHRKRNLPRGIQLKYSSIYLPFCFITGSKTMLDKESAKFDRNGLCPCGSEKKYKLCHGR
jgi:uncharacterized protein YecA (UPF0149 family)